MKKESTYRLTALVLTGILAITMLAGCGFSEKSDSTEDLSAEDYMADEYAVSDYAYGSAGSSLALDISDTAASRSISSEEAASDVEYGDKIITTYSFSFETKEFDKSIEALHASVEACGGYTESSNTSGTTGYRCSYYTVRIPSDKISDFLTSVDDIGTAISSSTYTEDVTASYYDIDEHKKALQAQYDRLVELMAEAETVDEIISIQDRLSELEYEINSYATQLKVYDNQIDYTTFDISIDEVAVISNPTRQNLWTRIVDQFKDSFTEVGEFLQELVVFLIGNIPMWIVLAVIIFMAVKLVKLIMKMSKRRKEKQQGKAAAKQADACQNTDTK